MRQTTPPPASNRNGSPVELFQGFEELTANFIYCPNQFFDLCLPQHSRGGVRLVGYLLLRTLGWLNANGEPVDQDVTASYGDLVTEAGISRGAIREAIDEAIAAGFIRRVDPGRPNQKGQVGRTARYALRWDASADYAKTTDTFQGFYSGDGHRTPIPNAFFSRIVPSETLAVVKVVGTVLRHTVGYQNQFGGRRSQAPLSFSYIQRYAHMGDRTTLAAAVEAAVVAGYIRRHASGHFHPSREKRRPAAYAVRWLSDALPAYSSSKSRPAAKRFRNPTSEGSKSRPDRRFKIQTEEKTLLKDTYKQQDAPTVVVAQNMQAYLLLINAGFNAKTAVELSRSRGVEEIQNQITWLPKRNIERNRLGMLRRAIEQTWAEPSTPVGDRARTTTVRRDADENLNTVETASIANRREQRREERTSRLIRWRTLSIADRERLHKTAIKEAESLALRRLLIAHTNLSDPPNKTLDVMARSLTAAVGQP